MQQTYVLLRGREIPDLHKLDVYVKNGGYDALKKAVAMPTADIINIVKASNLRGRGGLLTCGVVVAQASRRA